MNMAADKVIIFKDNKTGEGRTLSKADLLDKMERYYSEATFTGGNKSTTFVIAATDLERVVDELLQFD